MFVGAKAGNLAGSVRDLRSLALSRARPGRFLSGELMIVIATGVISLPALIIFSSKMVMLGEQSVAQKEFCVEYW